jgi:fatty acid desaturase
MSITQFTSEESAAIARRRTSLRFLFFPFQIASMVLIAYPWPVDNWAVRAFWILVTSYFMFCWTSCFHETAHQTLFQSQRLSMWLGRVLGWLMFVPYTAYRETHIRHHAYLNKPNDWELWPYADPNSPRWFRHVFVWFDLLAGVVAAPILYGRIYFHPNSPLRTEQCRAVRWEYFGMVCFWAAICAVVGYYGKWTTLVLVYFVPQWLAGIYQNGRKLTEHLGMRSYDPLLGTRTVVGNNLVTRLATFLNFDIFVHGPHHRHPRVSHDQLEALTREYVATAAARNMPVYPTYASAARDMVPWMFANPGVGMNVGAPPPDAASGAEVDNFVADVTQEVLHVG